METCLNENIIGMHEFAKKNLKDIEWVMQACDSVYKGLKNKILCEFWNDADSFIKTYYGDLSMKEEKDVERYWLLMWAYFDAYKMEFHINIEMTMGNGDENARMD